MTARLPEPTMHDLMTAIAALRAEVRALRRPSGNRQSRTSAADRARLALLYPPLADVVGDHAFTSAELVDRAALNDSESKRLTAAVEAVAGTGKSATRRLGILLARGEGLRIASLTLEKVGQERDGAIWVLRVS